MGRRGKIRNGEQTVPAEPFSRYIQERIAEIEEQAGAETPAERNAVGASSKVAEEFGWEGGSGVRRLYRYKMQQADRSANSKEVRWVTQAHVWSRATVEDACHRVHPDLFYELYPEFQHERLVTLEPDAWCPFCNEYVTPIDGLCPWCVCEHGHLFREVGITDDGFACLACAKKEKRDRERARERKKPRVRRTHCANGHEFTEENTYRRADGGRMCKTCVSARGREYRARKRAA